MRPSAPQRPASAPPGKQHDRERPVVSMPARRYHSRKEREQMQKEYIREHDLHVVLGDCVKRCLSEMPSDPTWYLSMELLEHSSVKGNKNRIIELEKGATELNSYLASLQKPGWGSDSDGEVSDSMKCVTANQLLGHQKIDLSKKEGATNSPIAPLELLDKTSFTNQFYNLLYRRSPETATTFAKCDLRDCTVSRILLSLKTYFTDGYTAALPLWDEISIDFDQYCMSVTWEHFVVFSSCLFSTIDELSALGKCGFQDPEYWFRMVAAVLEYIIGKSKYDEFLLSSEIELMMKIPTSEIDQTAVELCKVNSDYTHDMMTKAILKNLPTGVPDFDVSDAEQVASLLTGLLEGLKSGRLLLEFLWIIPMTWHGIPPDTLESTTPLVNKLFDMPVVVKCWNFISNTSRVNYCSAFSVSDIPIHELEEVRVIWSKFKTLLKDTTSAANTLFGRNQSIVISGISDTLRVIPFLDKQESLLFSGTLSLPLIKKAEISFQEFVQKTMPENWTTVAADGIALMWKSYLWKLKDLKVANYDSDDMAQSCIRAEDLPGWKISPPIKLSSDQIQLIKNTWRDIDQVPLCIRLRDRFSIGINPDLLCLLLSSIIESLGTMLPVTLITDSQNHRLFDQEQPSEMILTSVLTEAFSLVADVRVDIQSWIQLFASLPWGKKDGLEFRSLPLFITMTAADNSFTVSQNVAVILKQDIRSLGQIYLAAMLSSLRDFSESLRRRKMVTSEFGCTTEVLCEAIARGAKEVLSSEKAAAFVEIGDRFTELMFGVAHFIPRTSISHGLASSLTGSFSLYNDIGGSTRLTEAEVEVIQVSMKRLRAIPNFSEILWLRLSTQMPRLRYSITPGVLDMTRIIFGDYIAKVSNHAASINFVQSVGIGVMNDGCVCDITEFATSLLEVVKAMDVPHSQNVSVWNTWRSFIENHIIPACESIMLPHYRDMSILQRSWVFIASSNITNKKMWSSLGCGESAKQTSQVFMIIEALLFTEAQRVVLATLLNRLVVDVMGISVESFTAAFIESLSELLTVSEVTAWTIFMKSLVGFVVKKSQITIAVDNNKELSRIRANIHWASCAGARYTIARTFLGLLYSSIPEAEQVWKYHPVNVQCDRVLWLIDSLFIRFSWCLAILQGACERWQVEGMPESVFKSLPNLILQSLELISGPLSSDVVASWKEILHRAQTAMAQTPIYTAELSTPLSQDDISVLTSDTVDSKPFYSLMAKFDPTCPAKYVHQAISVLNECLEDCSDAPPDALLKLMPAEPRQTANIWAIVQALSQSVMRRGHCAFKDEVAWRRFFKFRMAPQLLYGNPIHKVVSPPLLIKSPLQVAWQEFYLTKVHQKSSAAMNFFASVKERHNEHGNTLINIFRLDLSCVWRFFDLVVNVDGDDQWFERTLISHCKEFTKLKEIDAQNVSKVYETAAQQFAADVGLDGNSTSELIEKVNSCSRVVYKSTMQLNEEIKRTTYLNEEIGGTLPSSRDKINMMVLSTEHLRILRSTWNNMELTTVEAAMVSELKKSSPLSYVWVPCRSALMLIDDLLADLGKDFVSGIDNKIIQAAMRHASVGVASESFEPVGVAFVNAVLSSLEKLNLQDADIELAKKAWLSLYATLAKNILHCMSRVPAVPKKHFFNVIKRTVRSNDWSAMLQHWKDGKEASLRERLQLTHEKEFSADVIQCIYSLINSCTKGGDDEDLQVALDLFCKTFRSKSILQIYSIGDQLARPEADLVTYTPLLRNWVLATGYLSSFIRDPGPKYITIRGTQYDVSSLMNDHPGGAEVLLEHIGKDATREFEAAHKDAPYVWGILEGLLAE